MVSPHVDDGDKTAANHSPGRGQDFGDHPNAPTTEAKHDAWTTSRATPTAATSPSDGQAIEDNRTPRDCIDTRNRVYLVLGTPLGDDETPKMSTLLRNGPGQGRKRRVAHRQAEAEDRIAPTLTVERLRRCRDGRAPAGPGRDHRQGCVRRTAVCAADRMVGDVRPRRARSPATVPPMSRPVLTARTPGRPSSMAPPETRGSSPSSLVGEDRRENVTISDGWDDTERSGLTGRQARPRRAR